MSAGEDKTKDYQAKRWSWTFWQPTNEDHERFITLHKEGTCTLMCFQYEANEASEYYIGFAHVESMARNAIARSSQFGKGLFFR